MIALHELTRMVGQVRSEMRMTAARELPKAAPAMANEDLGRFEQSIRRFKFRLQFEERRDPEVQKAVRDLNRLYEDLLHFFSQPGEEAPVRDKADPQLILTPVRDLSSLLANGH
jgi:hypothetical protein